jgi:tetratricopeptide (TPR) repeat protein
MMKLESFSLSPWLSIAAVSLALLPAVPARAQTAPVNPAPATAAPATPAPAPAPPETSAPPAAAPAQAAPAKPSPDSAAAPVPDRSQAYYHLALANTYEEEAMNSGRSEFVTRAIEEYKLALNADPASAQLGDGLADLYFRTGHTREAIETAKELLKTQPADIDAHKLLGHIYLRSLGEGPNAASPGTPSGDVLELAIAEFEKIVELQPKSVEDRMVLGQLYTAKHESKKAEREFKIAEAIEPESEEVVLNLARLYAESGDIEHAGKVIEAVPVADRTPKMESVLGGVYDQLKRPKDAIAAYERAADMDPDDLDTLRALAQALLNDDQLDAALKQFRDVAGADPEDTSSLIHIAEILRRQGKYEEALSSARKASLKEPENLEAGYNEGLLMDVLGRYDEAAQVYEKMLELPTLSHANGAYTSEEKNNRAIFLDRLGAVYHEQNKTDKAIATYQKMIEMGGDAAISGYRGEVDTLNDARMFDKAVEVARKAVAVAPKDREIQLMLAGTLLEQGKPDDSLALARGLLDNSNEDRAVWVWLGQTYTRLHRWKDADDALAKVATLTTEKKDRITLYFLKGELAERQKHLEPAEQFFRQVLDLDPSNAMTLNYLGYMLADKGIRLNEALKMIRQAVDQEPMNGAYLDSLGWAYFKLGQYELAEENLRQAVERDQTDPTVHDHLGDLYEKTGRIRLAAAQWEFSVAEYAKSATLDVEQADVAKVQHKLETARVKLAKQESAISQPKPE